MDKTRRIILSLMIYCLSLFILGFVTFFYTVSPIPPLGPDPLMIFLFFLALFMLASSFVGVATAK